MLIYQTTVHISTECWSILDASELTNVDSTFEHGLLLKFECHLSILLCVIVLVKGLPK